LLGYLNRLPVGKVEIDRSFIEYITEDADALAVAGPTECVAAHTPRAGRCHRWFGLVWSV
jgi:sensor c-di-GMP phosphodiesterase-like protein